MFAATVLAASRSAGATPGAMGSRSQASLAIRVSVMPHVDITEDSGGGLSSASNAPAIRYSLVDSPAWQQQADSSERVAPGSVARPGEVSTSAPRLILVVPD